MSVKVDFQIPTKPLGNLIQVKRGISWDRSMEREIPSSDTYPVLRIPNVQDTLVLDDLLYISRVSKDLAAQHTASKGWTILVGSNGNPDRVGNPVFIQEDQGFLFASFLMAIAPIPNSGLDPKYLYHFLKTPAIQQAITDSVQGTTGLKNLSQRTLFQLPLPCYGEPEQRRIADILDTIDAAIQPTEALIAKLKQARAGLLHDLLTRGIDEHGHLRDPDTHPEQFKDSPLGRIPRTWEARTIDSLAVHVGSGATPRGGSNVYGKEGVLFIRSQNVTFDGLRLDDVAYINARIHAAMERSEIFPHDVLLNITGASIGRCCPFPEGMGLANVNQHVCAIRLPEPRADDATYLSSVLSSHIGQSQIDRLNAGGNRQGLNYQQLRAFVVPWPCQDERARVATTLNTHDACIRSEEGSRDKLNLTKQGLMDDLLTGRVRVSESDGAACG